MAGGKQAWVTLATNDTYALGALVVAHSLKNVATVHEIVVMITESVSTPMRTMLENVFNFVHVVKLIDSGDETRLALMNRPDLGITFTKLNCWRLTQYSKCVFLDADVLVLKNSDELFEYSELSAARDVGWPDCFNSGVFVFEPSLDTYSKLLNFAVEKGSFDGADQGLLNQFFTNWNKDIKYHLPFVYNVCATATYSYLPAFLKYLADLKIIHFIGAVKPWMHYFDVSTRSVKPPSDEQHLQQFLQIWWDIFRTKVHPALTSEMAKGEPLTEQSGVAAAYARLSLEDPLSYEKEWSSQFRKELWERGNIDYRGEDAFQNIQQQIERSLMQTGPGAPPEHQCQTVCPCCVEDQPEQGKTE